MHLTCTIPRDWLFWADLKLVWVVKDGGLLGWSDLVICYGGGGWPDGLIVVICVFSVLRMVWRGTGICMVVWSGADLIHCWWSNMEVCLRKMVWSECWKLKKWEAELIVANGSIRVKRDSCIRKVEEKNRAWGSMGKNSHSFKTRITHSFLSRIPTRSMLRKTFLQIPAAKKILTRKNLPNHPLPLTNKMICLLETFWNIIQTLCRPRVRAWCTSHKVWQSRFHFVVVYFKAKQEQFIRNLPKNYGNHLKTDARTD